MKKFDVECWRNHVPGLQQSKTPYAVLVPVVYESGKEPALLFEVRSHQLRRQPGEVCFPGGRMEPGETPIECALREAWEELGIPAEAVEVIGTMDFIANRSGFLLYPILAKVMGCGMEQERINPREVDHTFTVPVSFFEQTAPELWNYPLVAQIPADFPYERTGIARDYPWKGDQAEVAFYFYENYTIWGLTAGIVRQLFT